MNREIIDINDFTVLVEEARTNEVSVDRCFFDEPVIAVAFYGSGNVDLSVQLGEKNARFQHTKGLALSFYAENQVCFEHTVTPSTPLECVVIATKASDLAKLPRQEFSLFKELTQQLVNPTELFVEGPSFYMSVEMQSIVNQIFNNRFVGEAKMLFFKAQVTSLLAHFFGELSVLQNNQLSKADFEKLQLAQQILENRVEEPPSLTELAKEIGLNTHQLKSQFKEVFGVPVFKYLQNHRLEKAHALLREQGYTVQEAAWQVGYDSLSSFSNAFAKKFGVRPSEVR